MRSSPASNTQANRERKLRRAAFIASLLIYAVLIGVNLDPEVTEAQAGVAGDRPFRIPAQAFFIGLNAILFFPIFWWTPQFVKLHIYASQKETNIALIVLSSVVSVFGLVSMFASVNDEAPEEIRRARNIAAVGLLYFVALAATWIVLAARAGV